MIQSEMNIFIETLRIIHMYTQSDLFGVSFQLIIHFIFTKWKHILYNPGKKKKKGKCIYINT